MNAPIDDISGKPAAEQLGIFRRAATLLASSLEFEPTLANVISACLPALGDFGFFDVVAEDGVRRTARAHLDPETEAILLPTQWVRQERTDINLCALSSGKAALHTDIDDAWYRMVAVNDDHLALLRRLAFRSMLTVPMRYGDELIGSLTLFMAGSGRQHTAHELSFAGELAALAAPVVGNVRLLARQRAAEAALRISEERLRLATDAGKIGIWDWDILSDKVTWSDRVNELHGLAPGQFQGGVKDFAALVHPEDWKTLSQKIAAAIRDKDIFSDDFRVLLPDGSTRWLSTWARLHRDSARTATRMVGATIDISDRKHAEAALHDVNARLEQRVITSNSERERIWRLSQDILVVTSFSGHIVSTNPAFQTILGWNEEEARAIPFMELAHPEQHNELTEKLAEMTAGKPLDQYEVRSRHKDGSYRWISWSVVPEGDFLYGIGHDVTALRKQGEQLLVASEMRLQLALEVGGMGAWQWNVRNGKSLWWPGMEALHGLPSGVIPTSLEEYQSHVHPDDRERLSHVVQEALNQKKGHRIEYRVIWPDGSVHWVEGRGELFLDEQGEPMHMAGICVDITQRKRTEQDLRFVAQVSAELASLVDHQQTLDKIAQLAVPSFADWCAVDLLNEQGKLTRVAVAHVDPEKVALAHELDRRYPPNPDAPAGAWQVVRTGQAMLVPGIDEEMLRQSIKDAEHLAIIKSLGLRSYIGVPLALRGKTMGAITFISAESGRSYAPEDLALAEDIGRRAAIAIENARLYLSLREADRRKDDFLAMLAHELRNPLAPIRAAADVLKLSAREPVIEQTGEVISRQVAHMTGLVDDLLDVSRVNRGLVSLERRPVALKDVITAAIEQVRPLIDARRHRLVLDTVSEQALVDGDEKRLVQVVGNLLNNAAKYTAEQGEISLHVATQAEHVELSIRDNGIGIAPDLAGSVFELFVQGERPSDRSQGGLGLGLALVKSLVELHGGEVSVRSKGLGYGSAFVVRLPRLVNVTVQASPSPHRIERVRVALRIMVVDDNADAAQTLAMFLQLAGHHVQVAFGSARALELLQRESFEVCLLDLGLPDMDGNALARRINSQQTMRAPVLIAITGYGHERDRETARASGFQHYLVKPVDTRQLMALLENIQPQPR